MGWTPEKSREYYLKNKESIKSKSKLWKQRNKEKAKNNQRKWAKENKDKIAVYAKKYGVKAKDKIKKYLKEYAQKNKNKMNIKSKKWRSENKPYFKKYSQAAIKNISNNYIRQLYFRSGIKINTPDIFEIKRNIIKLKRIIKNETRTNL